MAFDFDDHQRRALAAFTPKRSLYADFAGTVKSVLAEALRASETKAASLEARAKGLDSFAAKAATPSEADPEVPKYSDPLAEITDLAAARIITFSPSSARQAEEVIQAEFDVMERADKAELLGDDRVGYQSVHYLVRLSAKRLQLPEYQRYAGMICEIQVRTVLQHAWAEIEHDIQYKSVLTIPTEVKRRFVALAGLFEIADREFQAIQDQDAQLRVAARQSVKQGQFQGIEITPDSLKTYLDKQFGSDARMSEFHTSSPQRH